MKSALANFQTLPLKDAARQLLAKLGYKSEKFTIVENTPIDQEIALDPELLGKVFENLLASYNEETKTTARKQTGSFYTPRPIVDYMVDESLKAHLTRALVEKSRIKELDALPGQLFYSTQIPVCPWFLAKNKAADAKRGFRDRRKQTLFIDACKLGTLINRVHHSQLSPSLN